MLKKIRLYQSHSGRVFAWVGGTLTLVGSGNMTASSAPGSTSAFTPAANNHLHSSRVGTPASAVALFALQTPKPSTREPAGNSRARGWSAIQTPTSWPRPWCFWQILSLCLWEDSKCCYSCCGAAWAQTAGGSGATGKGIICTRWHLGDLE